MHPDLPAARGPEYRAMCSGKRRHANKRRAKVAALRVCSIDRKQRGGDTPPVRVYRCPYCAGWHVGHDRLNNRQRRTEWSDRYEHKARTDAE